MPEPQWYTAIQAFATELDGVRVHIAKGENVQAGHPLIARNPQYFQPIEMVSRWTTMEQATAAPGEHRDVGRRGPGRPRKDSSPLQAV